MGLMMGFLWMKNKEVLGMWFDRIPLRIPSLRLNLPSANTLTTADNLDTLADGGEDVAAG